MWLHNCLYLTHSKVFRSFIHVLTTALTSRFWKQSKTHLSITSSKQLLSFLNCKYSIYWFIWECISIGLNYPFSQVWFFSTFLMEILREKLLYIIFKAIQCNSELLFAWSRNLLESTYWNTKSTGLVSEQISGHEMF